MTKRLVVLGLHALRTFAERDAERRERHAVARALEETEPHLVLQPTDRLGKRRGRHRQAGCCTGQLPMARHFQEVVEVTCREGHE
ncbi:hypothetical protein D3C72_1576760 [compost metagenome]